MTEDVTATKLALRDVLRRAENLIVRLDVLERKLDKEDEDRYVRVHFPGNTKAYTYELAPGHYADVNDYLTVHSPFTGHEELVRVAFKGRGTWPAHRPTKIARQIRWEAVLP